MGRGGMNVEGMGKFIILIFIFLVGMWYMNGQKPLVTQLNSTILWAIGAVAVLSTVVVTYSYRSPFVGWLGGFISYVALLYLIGGIT